MRLVLVVACLSAAEAAAQPAPAPPPVLAASTLPRLRRAWTVNAATLRTAHWRYDDALHQPGRNGRRDDLRDGPAEQEWLDGSVWPDLLPARLVACAATILTRGRTDHIAAPGHRWAGLQARGAPRTGRFALWS